jgi:cytochrome c-type biogenesis protein CcmF
VDKGKDIAPPVEPVQHYNSIQVWVAIVLALLSGSVLYLRFKTSDAKTVWKRLAIAAGMGLMLALAIGFTQNINSPQYVILLFATSFAIVACIYYAITVQKVKLKKLGASTAHLGFALSLLGILLSSFNKEVISFNSLGIVYDYGKSKAENIKESRENTILFKNTPVAMGDYFVTYKGDSTAEKDPRTFYKVYYERRDSATKALLESFTLYPDAFVNPKGQQGLVPNPASRHYLHKDIFTYVTSAIDPTKKTDTATYKTHKVHTGDTIYLNNSYMVFKGFNTNVDNPNYKAAAKDIAVTAMMQVYDLKGPIEMLDPVYFIRDGFENEIEDTAKSMSVKVKLAKILPDENAAEIKVKESAGPEDDYIVMKAILFPFINVLWLGIIVMVIGFFISAWNRITKKEKATAA